MLYLKKSFFGLLFLAFFTLLHFFIMPLFSSYEWIFGLNQSSLTQMLNIAFWLLSSAVCFVIFAALCNDRWIGLGISVLGAFVPLAFSQSSTGIILAGFYLLALTSNFFLIEHSMKHYISFSPITLLVPHIKTISTMILLIICIGYYLSINVVIKQKGFAIPEAIIPDAIVQSLIDQQSSQFIKGDKYIAQLPQLTPEQLQLLKQNPELLRSYGVDPAILEQYDTSTQSTTPAASTPTKSGAIQVPTTTSALTPNLSTIKKMALAPINNMIKQFQFLVAPILALLLFSAISFFFFLFFLFNLISGVVVKTIFYILEKTKFIHFEKEMREVQKLVV